MGKLRDRLKKLMENENIETDSILLRKIYIKLGKNPDDYRKEAGNFSKMISEERPFNKDYYIPLEQIFNVPMNYILNGNSSCNKKFMPRGFEYVAAQNSYECYDKLFKETDCEGKLIISNQDEYNNTIFDYIISYNSDKGIEYIFENDKLVYIPWQNAFHSPDGHHYIFTKQAMQVLTMILDLDDENIFHKAIDFTQFINYPRREDMIICKEEFIRKCLETKHIIKYLCQMFRIDYSLLNGNIQCNFKSSEMFIAHPLINGIIKYALENINTYQDKLILILKEIVGVNYKIIKHIKEDLGLKHLSALKIEADGAVMDNYIRLGIIGYYEGPVNPDWNLEIKARLSELISQLNEIRFNPRINWDGTLKEQWSHQGDIILRKSSNNNLEYEMLEYMKNKGFNKVPELISSKEGVDTFKYIIGSNKNGIMELPNSWLKNIARYFKEFHNLCKEKLTGKVYCHNSLAMENIVFNQNEGVAGIVDWKHCTIGESYYDLIYIICNWFIFDDFYFNNRNKDISILNDIKYFLKEYDASEEVKQNFGSKILDYLDDCIDKLDKKEELYKNKYFKFRKIRIFFEIYLSELNNL